MIKDTFYISDLDMTLLNSEAELSPFAKLNINNFIKNGVNFTIASARSVKSIQPIFEGVDLQLPVIEFNGAFISDLKTGNHRVINALDQSALNDIRNTLSKYKQNYFLSTYNGKDDKLYYSKTTNSGENWYVEDRTIKKDPRLCKIENINLYFKEEVVCITIIDVKENIEPIIDEISSNNANIEIHFQENPYSPGWFWLTVHSNIATKDKAIESLLKQYNMIDANVTAFGDNTNDIKMLKYASKAVAVENACIELKEVADDIIGNNDDDSVIKYIAKECNLELIDV
ncbi:MAG: HAD-IIB family hydrolase [Candidatus Cloacimonetes bacterium]|nr:HAD-IIB family hydrolase [Candidatus Cloacimonadota bacterium]